MKHYSIFLVVFSLIVLAVISKVVLDSTADSNSLNDLSEVNLKARAQDTSNKGTRDPYLRITSELTNQTLTSGEKLQLRCKVDGWPRNNIMYTWYRGHQLLSDDNDTRISIQSRATLSKLKIKYILSSDSGLYRCEVSNEFRRVITSAYITVSFSLPPIEEGYVPTIPEGVCEKYTGRACKSLLDGKLVYIESLITQTEMEEKLNVALNHIANANLSLRRCGTYAHPALCHFVFPSCENISSESSGKYQMIPVKLCREDCEWMKYNACNKEFLNSWNDPFVQTIFTSSNCEILPAQGFQSQGRKCMKVGLPSSIKDAYNCYNNSGSQYRGSVAISESGKRCIAWPRNMTIQFPELAGGHNLCRNPQNEMKAPWCFVENNQRELCRVNKCVELSDDMDMMTICIPSVTVVFLIGCIIIACCSCRKRNNENMPEKKKISKTKFTPGMSIAMSSVSQRKSKVPEINASSIHLLLEMGNGRFGKVYKAKVHPNSQFSTNSAVAVKTLRQICPSQQLEEFEREVETFSELQHENVACLKAIVIQPSMRCMVFEYTNDVDLHEYLASHSPQPDFIESAENGASGQLAVTLGYAEFMHMATQIACGMEYLSTNNFIHRDLAARNILVCGNTKLKICNLSVVRDSHLSSYYRCQNGEMFPIRWMAAESLKSWQYSDKSTIWSFGVVIWELFSYGMQPYCGYSNHEVLELVPRYQLLTCPHQCPARVYSLMQECWTINPYQRPQFKDIRTKLQGWEYTNNHARVTSQLAQGIHRQLTDAIPKRSAYCTQYTSQASSIGGSSGITCNSNAPRPTPSSLPHQGFLSIARSSTSTPIAYNLLHPGINSFSQKFSSSFAFHAMSKSTSMSQCGYQNNSQIVTNKNYYQEHRNGMTSKLEQPKKSRTTSQSNLSCSSCASSTRDQFSSITQQRFNNGGNSYDKNMSNDGCSQAQRFLLEPKKRPLSEVIEIEDDTANEGYVCETLAPHPISSKPTTVSIQSPINCNKAKSLPFHDKGGSDMSCNIMAISYDSGLPVDDLDAQSMNPEAPLVGPPRIPRKTFSSNALPKKFEFHTLLDPRL